jgi:hypothetical protein
MSVYIKLCYVGWATCRRKDKCGEEPRIGRELFSVPANRNSSVKSGGVW